ncbi:MULTISPECIES: hypothetical protein [unclassified Rhizobium]|uniref:hypothetical protein n=1 Tax=unclassified Rhizobium TaxID=2613769 RepID=UPI001AD9736B|nr:MULTISPECIES: hypothetical protein [unclassified Rhizobium]MBO9100011.1 hypothetical protein [Rhizobium sp. L58/93]QXZ82822.1 hypothetical protein J5287_12100 [Rhizobium sp. K1/93]QXZ89665.1 hypothetical protein J5280_16490 [Rhizobium sp. K15/93]
MMLAHIRDNFAAAFFPRLSEWAAAAGVFLIGLVLAANPDLMATTKTQAYQLMLMIATQRSWAMMLMVFGGARLVVLLINGAWRRSPHLRAAMAFFSCFPYSLIFLSFQPTFGISMVLASIPLGMDMINVLRAAGDARTIDTKMNAQRAGRRGPRQP